MPPLPALDGVEHAFLDLPTGVRAHVALAGPEAAAPVVLLHGWPQHWWCWRDVIRRLAADFRLVVPDLRGLGWSTAPAGASFAKRRLADDLLALLDALGLERVTLAGHDWGGWVAFLAALGTPRRFHGVLALSIAHPWQGPGVVARNAWRLAYQVPLAAPGLGPALVRDGRFPAALLRGGRRDARGWAPGEVEAYLAALPPGPSSRYYRDFLLRERPVHGRLRVPVRLLHGRRDPLGTALVQGLERHADDGTVELVDGVGHFLPEEAPDLVAARLRTLCG